jgi:hypothetical protein
MADPASRGNAQQKVTMTANRKIHRQQYIFFMIETLEQTMDVKSTARHVIDTLPARVTMDDVIHALYVASKFDRGEREIRAGKGIADEEARKRLSRWRKK